MEAGIRRLCLLPTTDLVIWGTVRPTKPITPLIETITPVNAVATIIITRLIRAVFTPRVVAVSSPSIKVSRLRCIIRISRQQMTNAHMA